MSRFSPTVVPQVFAPGPSTADRIFGVLGHGLERAGGYAERKATEQEKAERKAHEARMLRLKYGIVPTADLNELDPAGFNQFLEETDVGQMPDLADQQFGAQQDEDASGLPGNFNLFTGTFNPVRSEALYGGGNVAGRPGLRAALPASFNPELEHPLEAGRFADSLGGSPGRREAEAYDRAGGVPLPGGGESSLLRRRYTDAIPLDDEYSIVPEMTLDYQLKERERMRERAELEAFLGDLQGLEELDGVNPELLGLVGRYGGPDRAFDYVMDRLEAGDDAAADDAAAAILRSDPRFSKYFGSIPTNKGAAKILQELQEDLFQSDLDVAESYRRRGPSGGGELTAFQTRGENTKRAGAFARQLLEGTAAGPYASNLSDRQVADIVGEKFGFDTSLALDIVQTERDALERRSGEELSPEAQAFLTAMGQVLGQAVGGE